MKNLTFLLLFLALFVACKQKEEKLPVNPTQWLSQIKNEKAKKRTTDVLEKIYISTAYSVLEKDSLSEMQVKFANCELYDETKDIRIFKKMTRKYYVGSNDLNAEYLTSLFFLYEKDSAVFKAALNVILDTNFLYITDKPYSIKIFEKDFTPSPKVDLFKVAPSKKLARMENEVVKLLDKAKRIQDKNYPVIHYEEEFEQDKSVGIASKKLFQLIQEPNSENYAFPKISERMQILYSPDKKFRIFYYKYLILGWYDGLTHKAFYTADAYVQYRKSENDKLITYKIECSSGGEMSYCYPNTPKQIFKVEKNGNPVYIILSEYNGKTERYLDPLGDNGTYLQAIEIKEGKAISCKDCIEGRKMVIYARYNNTGSFAKFDSIKQQLSFVTFPVTPEDWDYAFIKRNSLKWNGQQLVYAPIGYCEE